MPYDVESITNQFLGRPQGGMPLKKKIMRRPPQMASREGEYQRPYRSPNMPLRPLSQVSRPMPRW